MLIILEGPDGAGKSHLKDRLAIKHGARTRMLHPNTRSGKDPMIEFERSLHDYDQTDLRWLWICDQWHASELINGPLYRGGSQLTPAAGKHIEMLLDRLGALKVIVTEPVNVLEDRLQDRGDSPSHNQLGLSWDSFNDWSLDHHGWHVVRSSKVYPKRLIDWAIRSQIEALKVSSMKSYVGSLNPEFLILTGNGPNPPGFVAALTPYRTHRNHAIMETLLPYDNFGILAQGEDQIRDAWPLFGRPEVIVIDPIAKAACQIAGIAPITLRAALESKASASI